MKGSMKSPSNGILPIGSIYLSLTTDNPATLFGGTWTQIKDTFLLTAGDNYSAGSSGGSATIALTVENMPSHTHTFTGSSATTSSNGAHTHTPSNANYHFQWMQSTSSDATLHLQVSKGSGYYVNGGNPSASDAIDSYGGIHHGANTNSAGAHTHTLTAKGTNSSTGSGEAFSNLPPYKVVYAWERTA